jgi:hypothetical protein
MSLEQTEAECAEGRSAPRVSLADIGEAMGPVIYVTGEQATGVKITALSVLTLCFVVMKNGFTVIGKAAPASPENFDVMLGRKLAYEDAVRQIWPLMGFALRDRLSSGESK